MAKHAYSASYDLGNKEIFQRLYLFSNSDQAEMACWLTNMLIQLTNTKLLDFTCRVVGGGHQLKVGIYINGESISLLNDFNESAHNGHTNSDYVVKTKEEFDEFYFDTESSNIQRVQNIHNAQQVPLISHINLFDLLGLLISDQQHWKFPFAIQFNIEHLTNLTEIQRATRKWLVKLDFDNLIPTQLKESLKRSAEIKVV